MNYPYISKRIALSLCYVDARQLRYAWTNWSLAELLTLTQDWRITQRHRSHHLPDGTLITGSMPHYVPFGLVTEQLERRE